MMIIPIISLVDKVNILFDKAIDPVAPADAIVVINVLLLII